ncbi:LysR family transcriptional regulator [Streptomyces sp. NBC_00878]|uniref:LysR family transcriptional regulator n=1 Tax=Streptomyces sp. NBC_00878 TaxID=2975854 RepID=UPI002259D70D|nr:LysR family transcriptional regulator [Streptomyces sp. NBC_00878]MCX4904238.1 LysR family transcriptional regulator [Streptomyces sp. NBC_00878]
MASMNVELRHLRAFVAVARTANFTRAAEQLHIAQPSLSHTIRQLETGLGFRLFARTTRSTALTPDGERFLIEAQAVLERFDAAMERSARMASGELGRLRVGYLIGAAVDHVPAILRAFADRYPDVTLEITEYDFASPNGGLDTGDTDVALVRPPLYGVPDAVTTTLLSERCMACVSTLHPFAQLPRVTVGQLLAEPIVAAPGDNAWRDYWILASHRGTPANITHEAATFEAELQSVAIGRGLSVVPESVARLYSRQGVRYIPIEGMDDCEVAVVHREGAPRSAANFARIAARITADAGRGPHKRD